MQQADLTARQINTKIPQRGFSRNIIQVTESKLVQFGQTVRTYNNLYYLVFILHENCPGVHVYDTDGVSTEKEYKYIDYPRYLVL